MHTTVITHGEPGICDVRIHHNGDWSGDAILTCQDSDMVMTEATIPGWVARLLISRIDPTHPDIAGEELT